MKTEKIIWGLILIFTGGILLLQNFNVIDFNWMVVWHFWPLILILIGANMLFSKENSTAGAIFSIVLTLAALSFITYKGIDDQFGRQAGRSPFNLHWEGDAEEKRQQSSYTEPFAPGTKAAVLNIVGGATEYVLKDSSTNLFNAEVNSSFGNFSLVKLSKDSTETINFKMSGKAGLNKGDSNTAKISLNANPVWDINVEAGAARTDFDLTAFKVGNLNYAGGASSFHVKLGQPLDVTRVNIEAGASEIEIQVPSSAACQIHTDSGLSSSSIKGFTKQPDGSFSTPGSGSPGKIIINFEGGLSSFKVRRY